MEPSIDTVKGWKLKGFVRNVAWQSHVSLKRLAQVAQGTVSFGSIDLLKRRAAQCGSLILL
jgi:hypothetical protein